MDPKPPETSDPMVGRLTEEIVQTLQAATLSGQENVFSLPISMRDTSIEAENSFFIKESEYVLRFLGKLPKRERIGYPKPGETISPTLPFELPTMLHKQLGINEDESELLDSVNERYYGEYHTVFPTNLPGVYFHSLSVEFDYGAGHTLEFFTVGIPIEKIRDLAKASGAITVSLEESYVPSGSTKILQRFKRLPSE